MVLLICEGACNGGQVQRFDQIVRDARSRSPTRDPIAVPSDWLDLARKFKHTAHKSIGDSLHECEGCGARRRYGSR